MANAFMHDAMPIGQLELKLTWCAVVPAHLHTMELTLQIEDINNPVVV